MVPELLLCQFILMCAFEGRCVNCLGDFSKPNYASGPEMCEQECHSPYCRNIYRRDDRRTEIYRHT